MNLVCLSVRVFLSHQKTQLDDILAQCIIWANIKHDEARSFNFWFLRILGAFLSFLNYYFLVFFFASFPWKSQPFHYLGPWHFDTNTILIPNIFFPKNANVWGIFRVFSYTNSKMMCLFTISSAIKHQICLKFGI